MGLDVERRGQVGRSVSVSSVEIFSFSRFASEFWVLLLLFHDYPPFDRQVRRGLTDLSIEWKNLFSIKDRCLLGDRAR